MYDLVGQEFGNLKVLSKDATSGGKGKELKWICTCICGACLSISSYCLRKGGQVSCGCSSKTLEARQASGLKHGYHRTPTYHSWEKMKSRCNNPNNPSYYAYGGIGITYDKRWETFEPFLEDMGDRPVGTSLDRINPFGNYGPDNCRWATWKEQANNTRRNTKFRGGDANVAAM